LPFRDGAFAAVVDTQRAEAAWDDEQRLAELVRVCRPGGTIALVACPGGVDVGLRTWDGVRGRLMAAGCEVARAVPFDPLGVSSPWRRRLGPRTERVLAELEQHLAFPEVRRAVRLLERRIVEALPLEEAGAIAVLARRRTAADRTVGPAPLPALAAVLASRAFGDAVLRLLRDDAVVRFAAFLDAEVLSPLGVPFDLPGYVAALGADAERAREAVAALLPHRRWWSTSFDVQRLLAAASHRLARRAIEALRGLPGATHEGVSLPATFEYDLIATLNRALERGAEGPAA
jgi:SAM-dependent methyltransferase